MQRINGELIFGVSNARCVQEIAATRRYVLYGALLQRSETTLFMQIGTEKVSETTIPQGVPEGAFTTLSVTGEIIELRVAAPDGTRFTISASHDEVVNPTLDYFCVTISDVPCDLAPCWSIL